MRVLSKRIANLELLQPPFDPIAIIIRFLAPGNLHSQFNHLSLTGGSSWVRNPNESQLDFEKRVLLEARFKQSPSNNLIFISGGQHEINK